MQKDEIIMWSVIIMMILLISGITIMATIDSFDASNTCKSKGFDGYKVSDKVNQRNEYICYKYGEFNTLTGEYEKNYYIVKKD